MGNDRESITAKVTPEMRRQIRVEAAKADMSMSEWIRESIDERLDDEEATQETPADD